MVHMADRIRSAQVRAYDDRAYCRDIGSPYKRAYALSSYALTYVALTEHDSPSPKGGIREGRIREKRSLLCAPGAANWVHSGAYHTCRSDCRAGRSTCQDTQVRRPGRMSRRAQRMPGYMVNAVNYTRFP